MLVKDSKTEILMETGHQQDAEEEKENKIRGFFKNFLPHRLVHLNLGNWNRFVLIKGEIHTMT
jgi:hypothetical protein